MKLLESLKWPLTVLVSLALVIVGAILIGGSALGVSEPIQTTVLGWVGGVGVLLAAPLAVLLAYLVRDSDHDGVPDELQRRRGRRRGPGAGGALVLLVAIAAATTLTSTGCGASALAIQADGAAIVGTTFAQLDAALIRIRAAELDQVLADARTECGAAGCGDARAAYYLERHDAIARGWAPTLACRGPFPEALRSWVDAIELANTAATAELGLQHVIAEAARVVLLYGELRECVTTARPDLDVPPLPAPVAMLAEGAAR